MSNNSGSGSIGELFSDKLRKTIMSETEKNVPSSNESPFNSAREMKEVAGESNTVTNMANTTSMIGVSTSGSQQFPITHVPSLASPQKQPFGIAKKPILSKNQSATDLSQYLNPDLLMRRRASLHHNALDPMGKKIRQREAYKTAMCQAWLEGKPCAFGDQCNFAHGEQELQPLPSNRANPKYKTRICENYTTTGICPFGNRCFFIHPQPNAKMDDLLEYQEALNQTARQLEGEAIYRSGTGSGPINFVSGAGTPPRRIAGNNKIKQFRKLESCGNFFTQFQLQQVQLQQLQREQQEQLARKMEQNFYDNFPPLSAVTGKGKEQVVSRKASKNTTVTGSMPLIHTNSASNLHFHNLMAAQPNNEGEISVERGLEERRLTFRKMQSQKSFSSSDVWYRNPGIKPKPLLEMDDGTIDEHSAEHGGSDSSGPHTPPGFYEQRQQKSIGGGFAGSSKWSSMSSTNPTHIWPGLDTSEQQKVPSFSLFGPTDQIGSGGDLLRLGGGNAPSLSGGGGKKSPISDFEGILMGRRSSHTPYLDEGENTQTFLDVVLDQGMQKGTRNRSAEFLLEGRSHMSNWLGIDPANQWQMGAHSTGALNTEKFAPWQTQFGPPEGPHQAQQPFWGSQMSGQALGGQFGRSGQIGAGGGQEHMESAMSAVANFQQTLLQQQQQQMAEYQQQQQQLIASGFINSATALLSNKLMGTSFPTSPSTIGNQHHQLSAFRPIRTDQFQHPLETSQYSSNSSVHASSLADDLIRQSQQSLASTNLDVMRQIWASSSPELDKDYKQQAEQKRYPLWSQVDSVEQKVEIPSKLDFNLGLGGMLKRNDALERVIKESKPEFPLSRNDTLTDTEKEEDEYVKKQQKGAQDELSKLYDNLNLYGSAGVIGSSLRKTVAADGSDQSELPTAGSSTGDSGYEAGSGANIWAKRAMKKAFLRQKSHSSPAISRSGSLAEKEEK